VRNNGPADATGVQITDQLPSGVAFVSASPIGAYDSATGIWTVGSVAKQTSATLTINGTMSQNQATNSASVTHSNQADANSNNNSASVTLTPPGADLALTYSVDNAAPK